MFVLQVSKYVRASGWLNDVGPSETWPKVGRGKSLLTMVGLSSLVCVGAQSSSKIHGQSGATVASMDFKRSFRDEEVDYPKFLGPQGQRQNGTSLGLADVLHHPLGPPRG